MFLFNMMSKLVLYALFMFVLRVMHRHFACRLCCTQLGWNDVVIDEVFQIVSQFNEIAGGELLQDGYVIWLSRVMYAGKETNLQSRL